MTLIEKIWAVRGNLSMSDFEDGTIVIENDTIVEWNHSTISQPTQEELA